MESRIEYCYLGNTRNQCFHSIDTLQVSRVMQRSQIRTFDYLVDHIPVDLHAGSELFTSMYHTVADSVDFHEIEACQSNGDWERAGEILAQAAFDLQQAGAEGIVL